MNYWPAIKKVKVIWEDDVFTPVTDSVNIPSLNHHWPGGKTDSPERFFTFEGHGGKYLVKCDWRLYA